MLDRVYHTHSRPDSSALGGRDIPFLGRQILMTVMADTTELIAVIDASLDEIARLSINMTPTQLHEHALHWRSVLSRFQYELRRLLAQLNQFSDFMEVKDDLFPKPIFLKIDAALERVNNAYTSLRSEMSIMEARRSMEEAESVSKLTELAFIFILSPSPPVSSACKSMSCTLPAASQLSTSSSQPYLSSLSPTPPA